MSDGTPSPSPGLSDDDVDLRNLTYQAFVELGRAPTVDEVASVAGAEPAAVSAGWERLHDAHALVLDAASRAILMANPFSAVPTPYRVFADDRWWYANCAWDAFGIFAALHLDGTIDTACPDCGDTITVHVVDGVPDDDTLRFHCLVAASHWWDDITFT